MAFKKFSKKQMQVLLWWCPNNRHRFCDAIICDGAVRSGKTVVMFLSFVFWAFTTFNGGNFAACGKTVSSLKRNIVTPMVPILNGMGFKCNLMNSKNILEISYKKRKINIWLFGGKDESSASLIQGMTLCGVLLDEVALMPRSFVDQALARCSVEGSKFWFNCNPDNPSHWFYTEWIKKAKTKNAYYLHFTMQDNPSLSKKMIKRYESLYTGAFYERYIKGLWVANHGLIYPEFSEKQLVKVPKNLTKYYISCDYGTVNPSSFGLWGYSDGVWYRVEEYYYNSRACGKQLTDQEYYEALEKLINGRKIEAIICDPSAASFITLIRRKGKFRVIPAKNDVLDGIRRVGDALKGGRIKICDNCHDIIREFSLYRWDDNAAKDCPRKENDHAMDDMRYFVSTVVFGANVGKIAGSVTR